VHFSKDPKTTPGPKTIPLQSPTTTPKKKKKKQFWELYAAGCCSVFGG